jgi:hypothetical protein
MGQCFDVSSLAFAIDCPEHGTTDALLLSPVNDAFVDGNAFPLA